MGERSRAPATEAAAEKLSLSELNQWISRAEFRALSAELSASLKKSAMKRLVWLEAQRENSTAYLHRAVVASDRYGLKYSWRNAGNTRFDIRS
jgi:hypothetical protein